MRKVKIVFFADILKEHFDGVSITLHQIIQRIPADEIAPLFVTPYPPDATDFPFPLIQCPYFYFPVQQGYRIAMPGRMKGLEKMLDDFKPDIIHWTSPSFLGSYAIRYARKRGLPISAIYHTHFPSYAEYYLGKMPFAGRVANWIFRIYYRMYRQTDLIFAPTRTISDFLIGEGIDSEKIRIWGRGVNTDLFKPEKRDQAWRDSLVRPDEKLILFVSRLVREKETDTLIRIYRALAQRRKDIKLVITGTGPDGDRLKREMPGAVFTGKLVGEDLARMYASADVFIFPSITETFGNVVLEALASGLPSVVADGGGPRDIVEHGVTGWIARPKDENDFLTKVLQVLDDEVSRKQMSNQAVVYAETQNWDDLCRKLFDMYLSLVTHG